MTQEQIEKKAKEYAEDYCYEKQETAYYSHIQGYTDCMKENAEAMKVMNDNIKMLWDFMLPRLTDAELAEVQIMLKAIINKG